VAGERVPVEMRKKQAVRVVKHSTSSSVGGSSDVRGFQDALTPEKRKGKGHTGFFRQFSQGKRGRGVRECFCLLHEGQG